MGWKKDREKADWELELQQSSGKKRKRRVVLVICLFLAMCLSLFLFVVLPAMKKRMIEERISKYIEELRTGYVSDFELNVPAEIYSYMSKNKNSGLKSVLDYITGGEKSIKKGWQLTMKDMEYSVESIEKNDFGGYNIIMTFSNRNLAEVIRETTEEISQDKGRLIMDALSGNIDELFWEKFEESRVNVENRISQSVQLQIVKNENGEWMIDMDEIGLSLFAAMTGIEEKYLEEILDDAENTV